MTFDSKVVKRDSCYLRLNRWQHLWFSFYSSLPRHNPNWPPSLYIIPQSKVLFWKGIIFSDKRFSPNKIKSISVLWIINSMQLLFLPYFPMTEPIHTLKYKSSMSCNFSNSYSLDLKLKYCFINYSTQVSKYGDMGSSPVIVLRLW